MTVCTPHLIDISNLQITQQIGIDVMGLVLASTFRLGVDGLDPHHPRFAEIADVPKDCNGLTQDQWMALVHEDDREGIRRFVSQALRVHA